MRTALASVFTLATIATASALASTAAQAQQKVDLARSEIAFVSKQMGVPVEGRFRKFDAQMSFDPKKPEAGKVGFTIELGSATIGNPETDAEMPKATWFNVARFPQATFQSGAIKGLGGGRFEVSGKLAIKGSSRDVVVPVTVTGAGTPAATATGSFTIKRLDFKIGEGDWTDTSMVANDVQIKFKLAISGLGAL